jgi:hypothetical protein
MSSHVSTARRAIAVTSLLGVTATLALWQAPPARAAGAYSVATFAELTTALGGAWADTEPVVVEITADLTASGTDQAYYNGPRPLTINGNGHTITYATNDQVLNFLGSDHPVTLSNLNLQGAVSSLSTAPGASIVGSAVTFDRVHVLSHEGQSTAIQVAAFTGPVVVTDSTFANAVSTGPWAGALNIVAASATISGSSFTLNSSHGSGAVSANSTPLTVTDSTFNNNSGWFSGGAIDSYGDLTIVNSTFAYNYAGVWGGALSTTGSLSVTRSTFANNYSVQRGGAVNADGGGTVTYSTFSGNSGPSEGAAIAASEGLDVTGSTFDANRTVSGDGGALSLTGGAAYTVAGSTFVDNMAGGTGGAIVVSDSPLDIQGSTFDSNIATTAGHVYATNATVYASASVFTSASPAGGCAGGGTFVSQDYNFDADGTCTLGWNGTGDIGLGLNPQLGALADNGGLTRTMLPAAGSPLIDAVPFTHTTPTFQRDQRGVDRFAADATLGAGYDMGAVEVVGWSQSAPVTTTGGGATLTIDGAYCLANVEFLATTALGGSAPVGVVVPFGGFSFSACTLPGETATVTLTLPSPVTKVYKTGAAWAPIPGATFAGNTVTYQITDGGPLDESAIAGYIVDPVATGIGVTFTG